MLQNLLYYTFSTYECMSMFILIMSAYRFPIFKNKGKLLASSILFTTLSFLITKFGLHDYNIIIQIPFVIVLFKFLFKENSMYAVWISVSGYVSALMIQGVVISLLLIYGLTKPENLQPFDSVGYAVQFFSSSILIVISLYIKKLNEGFGFDFSNTFNRKVLPSYKPYITVSIALFISVVVAYPFYFYKDIEIKSFLITVLILLVSFCSLIYLSIKRNKEEF